MSFITNKIFVLIGIVVLFISAAGLIYTTDSLNALYSSEANAAGTCGSCGDGGGSTGGGGSSPSDDGEKTPNPPSCDLSVNIERVYAGDQYTISWDNSPNGTYKLGGETVDPKGFITYTWNADNLFLTFEIVGNNAGGDCSDRVTVHQKFDTPVCDISLTLNTANVGDAYEVVWNGTPAEADFKINGVAVENTGRKSFTFTGPNYDRFTMTGQNGSAECEKTVEITKKPVDKPAPLCVSFTADKTNIDPLTPVLLKWETKNASKVTIARPGGLVQTVAANDQLTVTPSVSFTYVLTVENADGVKVDCKAPVKVIPPTTPTPRCDLFNIAKTEVEPGENFVIEWGTTNVTNASINNGVGSVSVDGPKTVKAPMTVGTYTYELTFDGNKDNACKDTIVVKKDSTPEPDPISCEDNVLSFRADDYSLGKGGGDVELTWNTTGLDSLSINGINSTRLSDSETIRVTSDRTFTLVGKKAGEQDIRCPLSIDVATGGGGGGGGSASPRCDLDISDERITRGESVTLKWRTWNTNEIEIKDDEGNILIESDDDDDLDGEITIKPLKDTTFTLNAIRGSRDRDCEVEVEVEGGVTLTQVRQQFPTVAGISLTQVPYTGFEAGPMMTFFFYALLAVWGLFVAYVVAVRKNVIDGFSFASNTATPGVSTPVAPVTTFEAPATTVGQTAARTADAPSNLPTMAAPVVGYAAMNTEEVTAAPEMTEAEIDASMKMTELENRAHMQNALFSSDAMRFFTKNVAEDEQMSALDAVIAKAKGQFPTEDGWVVINLARLESLMTVANAAPVAETATTSGGSLAEAIVTGNIVAAYQMISNRPMIALADAATELDGVIRARRGEVVAISDMLAKGAQNLSDEQIKAAAHALTSALDGVYTSEEDAVKMAIMKAVKVVS